MDATVEPRLVKLTVVEFADALAGGDPAPGGGSAVALAGGLGAALAGMVARLTLGRVQYAEHEAEMAAVERRADALRHELLAFVDADTLAYTRVMEAYRLPKGTPEEKTLRGAAIQEGLKGAADVPLATAVACVEVLQLAETACRYGNRNASSDAVVAALLAHAALQGAVRNVQINLTSIKDPTFCKDCGQRVTALLEEGAATLARAVAAADAAEHARG
jgi:formiminotetrahydrofolate cyclodeaminase